VGSVMAVVVHSASSSAAVVTTSERWVSTSGATAIAPKIEGAAFALAFAASSSTVA
jgi:hypothetical protein